MADVLELVGIPKLTGAANSGGKNVEFVSVDRCKQVQASVDTLFYWSETILNTKSMRTLL